MSDLPPIPESFLRDEPPGDTAARLAALADRLRRLEAAYWDRLNPGGRRLVRRVGRIVAVDGDQEAM